MTNQHLTEEQFTDALTGDCDFEVSRHLHSCLQCQQAARQVQAAIRDFTAAGLEWAEQYAKQPLAVPSRLVPRWQAAAGWAAAMVLATAVLFGMHREEPRPIATVAASAASPVNVAEDNRLLAAIDTEIRWQAQSPVAIETSEGRPHSRSSRKLVN
jgi:hypothetical protein